MSAAPPRPAAQRKADTLAKLAARDADVWVSTASADGDAATPYLVPLSLLWTNERIVIALEASSRTARNIRRSNRARLGMGPTRDVVMIDVDIDGVVAATDIDGSVADAYAEQAGWDPRKETSGHVYITFRPVRIQAWREANELAGRTLMTDGRWTV